MPRCTHLMALALLLFGNVCLLYPQKVPAPPLVEDFDIEGIALFQCQCTAYACPCQKNDAPTHGTCEAADFAHINSGHCGKLRLDGLNVIVVGNLVDVHQDRLYATLYVDQSGTPAQRQALTAMLQFMYDAYETSPLKFSQAKVAPMEFHESTDKTLYTLKIPGILEEKALLKRDASGNPISTATAMDMWSNTEHYVDNALFNYHDQEVHKA